MDSLERLQGLHQDLVAFSETKLASIDRLWQELEASIEDFQTLLEKPPKNTKSRALVVSGILDLPGGEYQTNETFQQEALQIAEALDLDELRAAHLLLDFQPDPPIPGQSFLIAVTSAFHERRESLLQCLRLILQESQEHEEDDVQQALLRDSVERVFKTKDGPASKPPEYTKKCIDAMHEIEKWQVLLAEQTQKVTVVGISQGSETLAMIEMQKTSLVNQHEALGGCLYYLFRGQHTNIANARHLLDVAKRFERTDYSLIHYLPAFFAAFSTYGSCDHCASLEDSRSLQSTISQLTLKSTGSLQSFQGVLWLWWVCQYSSWYRDGTPDLSRTEAEKLTEERTKMVKTALKDGALTLLLSVCAGMNDDEWHHPARQELVSLLLSHGQSTAFEGDLPSAFFKAIFMECLEAFAESWIGNLPDSIRDLKNEEDDLRLRHIAAMQAGTGQRATQVVDVVMHLECFLVLVSYAYEDRPSAAEAFWVDPESNMAGFLQWASTRQTVPRVSAFCEMLTSITQGPDCAARGQQFLQDDASPTLPRSRKSPSMNYGQIYDELRLYAAKVNLKTSSGQNGALRKNLHTDMNELESPVMLSSYLRLMAHMCTQSPAARMMVLHNEPPARHTTVLLLLCCGRVPSYLKASVFRLLESCLSEKLTEQGLWLWTLLDLWVAGGEAALEMEVSKPQLTVNYTLQRCRQTFDNIAVSLDQYSAFAGLVRTLIKPAINQGAERLPFPDGLGSHYRSPGIDPYIDFVCGALFAKKGVDLPDDTQVRIFRFHCLDLMAIALETFDEVFVTLTKKPGRKGKVDGAVEAYVQSHPFARVMEWLYNEEVAKGLIVTLSISNEKLESLPADSLQVYGLQRCLDVVNLACDLQPTYLDIVRPLVRKSSRFQPISGSAIASVEDIVANHPEIVSELAQFAASSHDQIMLKALDLLQKLSCSTRFNIPLSLPDGRGNQHRRIVDMVANDGTADMVSLALAMKMETDVRQLELGPDCPGYVIKDGLLAFLHTCLAAHDDRPNVAHLFLGFSLMGQSLTVREDGAYASGRSLCHSVVELIETYPDGEDGSYSSWLIHIKTSALQVLRNLWISSLTSSVVVGDLRKIHFLASQFSKQSILTAETRWDGLPMFHDHFWYQTSAQALVEFLGYRNFLLDYTITEMRSLAHLKSVSRQNQLISTLQGISVEPVDGSKIQHLSILDMFDFANLDMNMRPELPQVTSFDLPDLQSFISTESDGVHIIYDTEALKQLINQSIYQRKQALEKITVLQEELMANEAHTFISTAKAINHINLARSARRRTLRTWVELIIVLLQSWPAGDQVSKTNFAINVMQLINPRLDAYLIDSVAEAAELLRLEDVLVSTLSQVPQSSLQGRAGSVIVDRQMHLFRTCISNIPAPSTSPLLRAHYYSIATQYLSQMSVSADSSSASAKNRVRCLDCVKSTGPKLIFTLSDDADNGSDGTRLSALVLLTLLTELDRQEKSSFVVSSLARINTLEIITDSIKDIANDLLDTGSREHESNLKIIHARLALLLAISRTRSGATSLLDVGLLQSVRESRLFSADPDLGFDSSNPTALSTYLSLLSFLLRLLVSTFLSRGGSSNALAQTQMRQFLTENRANAVGAFKRFAGIGVGGRKEEIQQGEALGEIVEGWVALMGMADFVAFEEPNEYRMYSNGFT